MANLRMLAIYAFLSLRLLLRCSAADAWCFFKAFFVRGWDSLSNAFLPLREQCGICGWTGHHFVSYVPTAPFIIRRKSCPRCQSLERHRALAEIVEQQLHVLALPLVRVLDVAPNPAISQWLTGRSGVQYLSIDLESKFAMRHMDVQHLQLDDASFDIVICFHVLDYVPDDRKAMQEFYRVLAPNGVFISQEGMRADAQTVEWGKPVREEQYRIRQYGSDYPHRVLAATAFNLTAMKDRNGRSVFLFRKP